MIVHSDSFLGVMVVLLMMVGAVVGLSASIVLLLTLKFRTALRVFVRTAAAVLIYITLQGTFLALAPKQTIVQRGDSYCSDIWCIGVTGIKTAPRGQDVIYKVDVHIFSDAGSSGKIHAKTILYLVDERGRRFPMIPDLSVVPFDSELAPQEGIDTTLTFAVPADAQQLYMTGDPTQRHSLLVRVFNGELLAGEFSFMRKVTLLRVV
jgi:hypothetical protein